MKDTQCDEDVAGQVRIHMCMQVCPEFDVLKNICFDDRFFDIQPVILCLRHQGL